MVLNSDIELVTTIKKMRLLSLILSLILNVRFKYFDTRLGSIKI